MHSRSGWSAKNTDTWRIRLEAQDTALSRLRHEFESRMRYHENQMHCVVKVQTVSRDLSE